jgi:hypothetical protein
MIDDAGNVVDIVRRQTRGLGGSSGRSVLWMIVRLHAARLPRRQTSLDDQDRRWQAVDVDADHDRGHEIHHGQSNLERTPLLRQDPTIPARMGLTVTQNHDGTIHISQPPGPNNALGQIRFNFPNKFLVYQHDSNQKYLFANPMRASSHGCMRVEDPVKYAEVLLALVRPGGGW